MRDVRKKVVAVALSSPKMPPVFRFFLFVLGVKVFAKPQDQDLSQFRLKVFAWKKHLVAWDKSQDALIVLGESLVNRNPIFPHRPSNFAGRFSKNACTPSA